ncbi:MAG: shikimate dehydrogenase [Cellvibrionaceae bacterium]|nr:shikimate dehydrogenase [Cellvibrionaceae bacterium]
MPDRYGVFGNPISHSKSPEIHRAFAKQTKQDLTYQAFHVESGCFASTARQFFRDGGCGLNITVPFKEEAFAFADELSQRAQIAGAVNTLRRGADGRVLGDNTDGAGFIGDLRRLAWPINNKKVLLIGAGGAARGVLGALLKEQPQLLLLANRTAKRAHLLAEDFVSEGRVVGGGYERMQEYRFDIIINATSASLFGEIPPVPPTCFASGCAVYDMVYANELTPFLALVKGFEVKRLADGIGMLVGQAAESFYLWRGVRPNVNPVIQQLKQATP